jgi:hypothetical protein
MRKWLVIGLIVLALAAFILTNVGSSLALSDLAARPVQALTRDETRVPVQQPGQPAAEGEARIGGVSGTFLGYHLIFQLPDGEAVACTIRFRSLRCKDRWTAARSG